VKNLHGMIVPLATPMTEDGTVDVARLRTLCKTQIQAGIDVLFVLGTTGEFYALTSTQRRQVVQTVLEESAGKVPVIAGISGDSTTSAREALAAVKDKALAGYVASTPYFLSYTQAELIDYFRSLTEAAGGPLVIYNFPMRYRHVIELDTVAELLREKLVFAIKDTSGQFDYFQGLVRLKQQFPEFSVFEGALANLPKSGPLGIDGSVQALTNLLPVQCAGLWRRIEQKQWPELTKEAGWMWEFHQKIEQVAIFIAAMKGCIELRGWCGRVPGQPTRPVSDEAMNRLKKLMNQYYPNLE